MLPIKTKNQKMNCYKFESGFNIRKFIVGASLLLLVAYGIFNARNLILGPSIEVLSPATNSETTESILIVKGLVKNTSFLSLNQKQIFANPDGVFEEKLLLSPGSNIIEIRATDRFKKETKKVINVYYKQ